MRYTVKINGKAYDVEIEKVQDGYQAPTPVQSVPVAAPVVAPVQEQTKGGADIEVVAPMPGAVLKILAKVGDTVTEGQTVVVLEAMKMEIDVNAPTSGTVKQILVNVGSTVGSEDVLIVLK